MLNKQHLEMLHGSEEFIAWAFDLKNTTRPDRFRPNVGEHSSQQTERWKYQSGYHDGVLYVLRQLGVKIDD